MGLTLTPCCVLQGHGSGSVNGRQLTADSGRLTAESSDVSSCRHQRRPHHDNDDDDLRAHSTAVSTHSQLGDVTVRTSDLQSRGRGFDSRSGRY